MDTYKLNKRHAPLEMSPEEFRSLGYKMVDDIAEFLASLRQRPVTPGEPPSKVRKILGDSPLPQKGTDPRQLLEETTNLLIDHSLFNGHPKFWGYITSPAAPIGMLGDLLASSVNPNVGAWVLSPVASEIEAQSVRWIAEMIDYPTTCGGLLVSGGNMANFICFLAARKAKAPWDVRVEGFKGKQQLRVYCSSETHGWINKAADLFGLGTDAIRWIPCDERLRMNTTALRNQIKSDIKSGDVPLLVVGTAGSVATGAIDPLPEIATICREHNLWFHADGAYGGFAAALPDASPDLKGLSLADSVAVDPHKWLYVPLEAGCALVKDVRHLEDTFSYHASYYKFEEVGGERVQNYYELGPQNSRGFRALKVWLAFRHVGREGYVRMISDDITLAKLLYERVSQYPELEAFTHGLSITTFRYVPKDLKSGSKSVEEYLNKLNSELLTRLQTSGEAFPSNAIINGRFVLRVCIVNFRTTLQDIEALPEIVIRIGREVDVEIRQKWLVAK